MVEKMRPKVEINVSERELEYRSKNYQDFNAVKKGELRCTTCSRNLQNDIKSGKIYSHPLMGTLQCKKCNSFYGDGDFSMDEDNTDKYCRLCGDGGDLIMCKNVKANCPHGFCKKCIEKNARKCLDDLDSEGFKCFICNIKPFWKFRAVCAAAIVEVSKRSRNHSKKPTVHTTSDSDDSRSQSDSSDSDFVRKPVGKRHSVCSRFISEKQQHARRVANRLKNLCDESDDDSSTARLPLALANFRSRQQARTYQNDGKRIPDKSSEKQKEDDRKDNSKSKVPQKKVVVELSSSESDDETKQEKKKPFKKSEKNARSQIKRDKSSNDTEECTSEEEHSRVSRVSKKIPQLKSAERVKNTKKQLKSPSSSSVSEEDSDHVKRKQTRRPNKNSAQLKKRTSHSSDAETEREKRETSVVEKKMLKTHVQNNEDESSSGKEFQEPEFSKSQKKRRTMRPLCKVDEDYTQLKPKKSTERKHTRLSSLKQSVTNKQGAMMRAHVTKLLNEVKALCTATALAVDKISEFYLSRNFMHVDLVSEVAVKCKKLKTRMRERLDNYETDFVDSCEAWCQASGVHSIFANSKESSVSDCQFSPLKDMINDRQELGESNLADLKPNKCSTPQRSNATEVQHSDSSASDEDKPINKSARKQKKICKNTSDSASVNESNEDNAEENTSHSKQHLHTTSSDSESEKKVTNTKKKPETDNVIEGSNQSNNGEEDNLMSDCDRDEIFSEDESRISAKNNVSKEKDCAMSEPAVDEMEVSLDCENSGDKDMFSDTSRKLEEEAMAVKSKQKRDIPRKASRRVNSNSDEDTSSDDTENEAARSLEKSDESKKPKDVSSKSDIEEPSLKNSYKSTQEKRKNNLSDSEFEETGGKKSEMQNSSANNDTEISELGEQNTGNEQESARSSVDSETQTTRSKTALAETNGDLQKSLDNGKEKESAKSPGASLKPLLPNNKTERAMDKLSDSDKSLFSDVSDAEEQQVRRLPESNSALSNDEKRVGTESREVSSSVQADRSESAKVAVEGFNRDLDSSMSTVILSELPVHGTSDSESDDLQEKISDAKSEIMKGRVSNEGLPDSDNAEDDTEKRSEGKKQKGKLGKSKKGSSHSSDTDGDLKKKQLMASESDSSEPRDGEKTCKSSDSKKDVTKRRKSKEGSLHSDKDTEERLHMSSDSDDSEPNDGKLESKSSDSNKNVTEQVKARKETPYSVDSDEIARKKLLMALESDSSESEDGKQMDKTADSKSEDAKKGKSIKGSSPSGDSDENAKRKLLMSSESNGSETEGEEHKGKCSDSKTNDVEQRKSKEGSSNSSDSYEDARMKLLVSSESDGLESETGKQVCKTSDSEAEVTEKNKSRKKSLICDDSEGLLLSSKEGSSQSGDSDEYAKKKLLMTSESDGSEPEHEKRNSKISDTETENTMQRKSKKGSSESGDSDKDAKKKLLMTSESDGSEPEHEKQNDKVSDTETENTMQRKSKKGSLESGDSDKDAKKKLLMTSESDGSEPEHEKQNDKVSDTETGNTMQRKSKKGSPQSRDSDEDARRELLISSENDELAPRNENQNCKTSKSKRKITKKRKSKGESSHSDESTKNAKKKLLLSSDSDGSEPEHAKQKGQSSETKSKIKNPRKSKQESSHSDDSDMSVSESDIEPFPVKRKINTDSESSSTVRTKRKKIKLDKNPYYKADKKLRMDCEVVVQRLNQRVLSQFSHVIERSKRHQERRAFKSLMDLNNVGKKKSRGVCNDNSSSDDDVSLSSGKDITKHKKSNTAREKEETLMDHLKKVKNGEIDQVVRDDSSDYGDDVDRRPKAKNFTEDDFRSEENKLAMELLVDSSDSEGDDEEENEVQEKKTETKEERKKDKKKIVEEPKVNGNKESDENEMKSAAEEKEDSEEAGTEEEEESRAKKDKKRWRRDKILTMKLSDTDSSKEEEKWNKSQDKRKKTKGSDEDSDDKVEISKKVKKPKRRVLASDSDSIILSDDSDDGDDSDQSDVSKEKEDEPKKKKRKRGAKKSAGDSDSSFEEKKTKRKRKRIKAVNSDSDSDNQLLSQDGSGKGSAGRKNIRKVLKDKQVAEDTKQAAKEEEERLKRIAERQKLYNEMYEMRLAGEEKVKNLVLDFDEETKEELVSVDENLVKQLKPHQAQGIKFMWDACFESLERAKSTSGSGCIIAHCMGLGKTFQVVTLVHTLLTNEKTGIKSVMVVCPLSTVLNWVNEFNKWLKDLKDCEEINIFEMTRMKKDFERKYQLEEWQRCGGVMIIGYEMFRNLSNSKKMRKNVQKSVLECLVDPGPDLIICDEGHLLKNEDTALSKAMRRVKTLRRIVLTGTPLQNNLVEYHCMVQFVKPNLLGTKKEFLNRFVNPITNGQFDDSTAFDVKLMKKRAHVLHKMLEGSVQRFDYSVLTPFLPPKQEYVILVRLSEVQIKLYQYYLDNFARQHRGAGGSLFSDFQGLQRIWTHPIVLRMNAEKTNEKKQRMDVSDSEGSLKDFIDDESDAESSNSSGSDVKSVHSEEETPRVSKRSTRANPLEQEPEVVEAENAEASEWWSQFVDSEHLEDLRVSSKLTLLFGILKESEQIGDKVLVFSQSLYSLSLIEEFLAKIDDKTQDGTSNELVDGHTGSWSLGLDYFRLDGSTSAENRSQWCKIFNRPTNTRARLFLISTRAGGLGINLTAANRVIIFDASWNPSHDVQSIFRIYRFGQKKPCYVYRFLAQGTMEEKIYNRQVTKLSLACRVVDEQQIERHYSNNDLTELYKFEPDTSTEKPTHALPRDRLLAEILLKYSDRVNTYHEHDSLLENKAEEELDEEERKQAWQEYEDEKRGKPVAQPYNMPIASQNHNLWLQQYNMMLNMANQQSAVPNNRASMRIDYEQLQSMIRKDYPNVTEDQHKMMTARAIMEMYSYMEKQAYQPNPVAQTQKQRVAYTAPSAEPAAAYILQQQYAAQQQQMHQMIQQREQQMNYAKQHGNVRGIYGNPITRAPPEVRQPVDISIRDDDDDIIEVPSTSEPTTSTVTQPPPAAGNSKTQEE